jgi:hypothetical protein
LGGTGLGAFNGNPDSLLNSTSGRVITCGQNVLGATVTLFDATAVPFHIAGLLVSVWQVVGGATFTVINLGVGNPLTTANTVIPNLMVQAPTTSGGYDAVYIPVSIPALTAVTMNGRSTSAGVTVSVSAIAVGAGNIPSSPLGTVSAYGMATFVGVNLVPSGAANTPGATATIGTVGTPIRELIIAFGSAGISNRNSVQLLVTIFADGQRLFNGLPVQTQATNEDVRPKYVGPIPVQLPTGTVLTANIQASSASTNPVAIAIYGVS